MLVQMINQRFGRLVVISEAKRTKDNHKRWLCQCDCGKTTIVDGRDLRKGRTKSCGCLLIEKVTKRIVKINTIHGDSHSRLYHIWQNMKDRCNRNKNKNYKHYGGRGIKVYDKWYDYLIFKDWALNNGYESNLTIERIDVNGNYEPSNCKWITIQEQQKNKRNSKQYKKNIDYKG